MIRTGVARAARAACRPALCRKGRRERMKPGERPEDGGNENGNGDEVVETSEVNAFLKWNGESQV